MVRFRVGLGLGVGVWGWGGARGDGEGGAHRSILDCSSMMKVLCVYCPKRACFVKAHYRPFVGCGCSVFGLWGVVMAGGVWWWWWCGFGGVGWVVDDHRIQHGGAKVTAWCMCCVYKAKVFRKQNYRRFDEGKFTMVGCKTNMFKQCIIVGCVG